MGLPGRGSSVSGPTVFVSLVPVFVAVQVARARRNKRRRAPARQATPESQLYSVLSEVSAICVPAPWTCVVQALLAVQTYVFYQRLVLGWHVCTGADTVVAKQSPVQASVLPGVST